MINPLYEAALEGQYVIDIDLTKEGDEYVARWNRHGTNVEVRDPSPIVAQKYAAQEALEQLKNSTVIDRLNG